MARWCGTVGYVLTEETKPGVWTERCFEKTYYGDLTRLSSRWENSTHVNDNVKINNEISILADPYAYEHFSEMRYVEFMGSKWKIEAITVERPRLILSIGGLYNGEK